VFLLAFGENSTVVRIFSLEVYQAREQRKAENCLGEDNETGFEKDRAKK